MSHAIDVQNLSKAYRLGQFNTGALSKDVERWWALFRGKEDPFLKVGESNDRAKVGTSNVVWSLRDINFQVEQGDTIGIIGKNGAGKSTLLKLLSRVTSPTSGDIRIKGRVASLLEVGTGFHPELTGRENIFLNGSILGMRRSEIKRHFDDIVDFAGVARYVDTPVKRYSSGMYVRLGFAVAAHLQSEILIVDEVLAVGDAEFQKKCLGKMNQINKGEGRTILFVSHNMTSISSICEKSMFLENGQLMTMGSTEEIIQKYISDTHKLKHERKWASRPGDNQVSLASARILNKNGQLTNQLDFTEGGFVEYEFHIEKEGIIAIPNIHVFNQKGEYVFVSSEATPSTPMEKGVYKSRIKLDDHLLNEGIYTVGLAVTSYPGRNIHFFEREALSFEVVEDVQMRLDSYRGTIPGSIRPRLKWNTEKL